MCGIFGVIANARQMSRREYSKALAKIFLLSETRGRESAGLTFLTHDTIRIFKSAMRPKNLLANREYRQFVSNALAESEQQGIFASFGHSRLVTNGGQNNHSNNQPVVAGALVGVHNGIVVNDTDLWIAHPELSRKSEVDTEVLLSMADSRIARGNNLCDAFRQAANEVRGTFSVAIASAAHNGFILATNNGSLYMARDRVRGVIVFASERAILLRFLRSMRWGGLTTKHLEAGEACCVSLDTMATSPFLLSDESSPATELRKRTIEDATPNFLRHQTQASSVPVHLKAELSHFEIDPVPIRALKRCVRCILPETVPYIRFDASGVCNFCHHHTPRHYLGAEALVVAAEKLKTGGNSADCLLTFSGGRDSSYGLHYAVRELGLRPVTYTYDWGLITDLARRNQARMCGALGIEHILVSADIAAKRANVRRNVLAWLQRPVLGMIPLFMAGDKQYFYYANRVAAQLGVATIMLASNPLEKTHFKAGFCGVAPELAHRPAAGAQLKMLGYYAREFVANPRYINRSLWDTAGAFASYYVIRHNHLRLFDYVPWVEEEINRTLIANYDWETASDTQSTWRIGDGTAAFYNYIYYQVAGFTENDTFRSNQIREGMLTREAALKVIEDENSARFDSLEWYCSVIGLDLPAVLMRIRAIPTLYQSSH